jgi:hypothetical protein
MGLLIMWLFIIMLISTLIVVTTVTYFTAIREGKANPNLGKSDLSKKTVTVCESCGETQKIEK